MDVNILINENRTAGTMPVWGKGSNVSHVSQMQDDAEFAKRLNDIEPGSTNIQYSEEELSFDIDSYSSSIHMPEESFSKYRGHSAAGEFGFGDLIDVVNPLQHIPLVGHMYRDATGDEIKPMARVIGGGIFGGVVGAASATANAIIEAQTGKDMVGHVMAGGNDESKTSIKISETGSLTHNDQNRYNG